jgi:hypothetical protein
MSLILSLEELPPPAQDRRVPLPPPVPADAVPLAFRCHFAGASALVRVEAPGADPASAHLVVERGGAPELVPALPMPMTDGTLGFACDRDLISEDAHFWLAAGADALPLGRPEIRGS